MEQGARSIKRHGAYDSGGARETSRAIAFAQAGKFGYSF